MKIDREKVVLFRTEEGLVIAMVENEADLKTGEFVDLYAPRAIVIAPNPQTGAMQMTFVPYAIVSAKTFLSEFVDNTSFVVSFNTKMIQSIIPQKDISTNLINNYFTTLSSIVIPSAVGKISNISPQE